MSIFPKVLPEVLRILRERAVVKAAPLSEPMKAKLLADLDARMSVLEADVVGAVQVPQRPK